MNYLHTFFVKITFLATSFLVSVGLVPAQPVSTPVPQVIEATSTTSSDMVVASSTSDSTPVVAPIIVPAVSDPVQVEVPMPTVNTPPIVIQVVVPEPAPVVQTPVMKPTPAPVETAHAVSAPDTNVTSSPMPATPTFIITKNGLPVDTLDEKGFRALCSSLNNYVSWKKQCATGALSTLKAAIEANGYTVEVQGIEL